MYTEEYEERGFPIRSFLIKFLIIVIIVLLLIWLLPKFVKPKTTLTTSKNNKVDSEEVYQDNLDKMQNAAFKYYDEDNLPTEDGKYDKVTLKELIAKDYVGELKDHNNKKLDQKNSYIKITKVEDNKYILKINIKDSVKEDYVLVEAGHFDYCEDYICKKIESDEEKDEDETEDEDTDTNIKSSIYDNIPDTGTTEEEEEAVLDESYKYTKTIPAKLSDWSEWSTWKAVDCTNLNEITCDNNEKCLTEVKVKNSNGVCYKSYRSRKVLVSSYTITRWSTENNKDLLNDGWTYVGR